MGYDDYDDSINLPTYFTINFTTDFNIYFTMFTLIYFTEYFTGAREAG
jgi:hypothetical protein